MRSVIYLATKNERKLAEWRRNFDRYGVEIRPVPRRPTPEVVDELLRSAGPGERVLALCKEQSDLVRPGTEEKSPRLDLELVDNLTTLRAYVLRDGVVEELTYTHRTPGYVDRSGGACEESGGWWDPIFRVLGTHLTYAELRQRGLKHSSRDMAISRFLLDHVHYQAPVDLNFSPQQQRRTIDFDAPLEPLLRHNRYLNNPQAARYGIDRMLRAVERGGVFFRSAKNRREKIYWWPGLNAGIPFTPKKDAIHEITYLVHDFAHFLMPDLIFTGRVSPRSQAVYVAYRMISEATSLVLADMLFVDSLARGGVDYDFSRRHAHPLLRATGLDLTAPGALLPGLERLLRANVAYCVEGNEEPWQALVEGAGPAGREALASYQQKYAPFFVEDFRWTVQNFAGMSGRSEEFARWWTLVAPLARALPLGLETLEDVEAALPREGWVEALFRQVFEGRLRPVFSGPEEPSTPGERRERAFFRYMIGQLAVLARHAFVPEAAQYGERIVGYLLENRGRLDLERIQRVRAFYERFLALLVERNLISLDDQRIYQEVFPLFEPFYVFYDGAPEDYEPLAQVAARALGLPPREQAGTLVAGERSG
jgi:hypothetical protein